MQKHLGKHLNQDANNKKFSPFRSNLLKMNEGTITKPKWHWRWLSENCHSIFSRDFWLKCNYGSLCHSRLSINDEYSV